MTLLEFCNENAGRLESVWWVSTAEPAGAELVHDTDTEVDEDYCDLNELLTLYGYLPEAWADLEGEATDGVWQWDGEGDFFDDHGNSLLNFKAFARKDS